MFVTIPTHIKTWDPVSFWNCHSRILSEDKMYYNDVHRVTDKFLYQLLLEKAKNMERNGFDIQKDFNRSRTDFN